MSIHAFYSKLMSGKEEGRLFEALRSLKGSESQTALKEEEQELAPGWSVWSEDSGGPAVAQV